MPPEASHNSHNPSAKKPGPTLRQRLGAVPAAARAALGWAMAHRLRAGLIVGAALASVTAAAIGWMMMTGPSDEDRPVTLEMALAALDSGAYAEARALAERLESQNTLPRAELGGPVFVLGAVATYEADETWSKDAANYYLAAARYLEEARDRGFPPNRDAEGLYLLGRSLLRSGQIAASRPILIEALPLNPRRQTEIHRLLAAAYLNDANPQLDRALAENALYLADAALPATARHEGLFERAQILLRLGRIDQCIAVLDGIPPEADNHVEAILLRGQVLLHQAVAINGRPDATADDKLRAMDLCQEAIETLRLAQGRDTLGSQATRKSMYLIGNCFLEMGDRKAASAQFARIRVLDPDTPEALAADLCEAEAARGAGEGQNASACYARVLRGVADPETFSNPWITLDELRRRILAALEDYLAARDFETAVQLGRQLYPLFPREKALQHTADAYRDWGEALLARAAELPDPTETTRRRGRLQLRRAGRVYWQLARLQLAQREYPDQIWNAANAYLAGQDYDHAATLFGQYVKDQSQRQPRGLVCLGEALLALGRLDEALDALDQCIESHSRDAAAFRARLLASRVCIEEGDFARAEGLLRENLSEQYLTPASIEWRDSLFALGELLHSQGRDAEAIPYLDEAVSRYPDAAEALPSRYLLADCYRRRAEAARDELRNELNGNVQEATSRQIDDLFLESLGQYRRTREELSRRREARELVPEEEATLRNCYFAEGDVLLALRQYDAAVEAYRTATHRYQDRPEVLEAYVRMAWAYRCLSQPQDACSTLEQAKVMLAQMKDDATFRQTTNYTRDEWNERLDWLGNL